MSTQKHILSNRVDIGYNDLKSSLSQRSDAFPVMLLPIRLETRFVKNTKSTAERVNPDHEILLEYLHQVRNIIHQIHLFEHRQTQLSQSQADSQINAIIRGLEQLPKLLGRINQVEKADKILLTKASKELQKAFSNLKLSASAQSQIKKSFTELDKALSQISKIKAQSTPTSELGNQVHRLLELMQAIYVDQSVKSLELDEVLREIEGILDAIPKMVNKGDIETNPELIKKISSEISLIKRIHKNSPITLQSYRDGYPGRLNLAIKEEELRKSIQNLKSNVDEEFVPYMNLMNSLRIQRALEIIYSMDEGYFTLKTENNKGYKDVKDWNKIQTKVNTHVKSILEDLNHPLEGASQEMARLKQVYQRYTSEINNFNQLGAELIRKANTPAPAPPSEKPKEPEIPVINIPEGRIPPVQPLPNPVPLPRPTVPTPLPGPTVPQPAPRAVPNIGPELLKVTNPNLLMTSAATDISSAKVETVAKAIPANLTVNPRVMVPESLVLKEKVTLGDNSQFIEEFIALRSQFDILNSLGISSKSIRDGAKNTYLNEHDLRQLASQLKSRLNQGQEVEKWMLGKLKNLEKSIRIRSANTGILPQGTLDRLRGAFNTLQKRYEDQVAGNAEENPVVEESLTLLHSIDLNIQNQYTDQRNNRTTFSKDYINQVRYIVESEAKYELWVRFFPDDIAVDDHDERLTEAEIEQGKEYFRNAYLDSEDMDKSRLAAWRGLAASVGVRRAAYIIQALQPSNFNVAANINNPLIELLKIFHSQFGLFLKDSRYLTHVSSTELSELGAWVNKIGSSLGGFTPCLETKPYLLESIEIFNKLLTRLLESRNEWMNTDPSAVARIRVLLSTLQNRLDTFTQYKNTHAKTLEKPFSRDFTYKNVEKKDQAWDKAGVCTVMPDRMVVGLKKGEVYEYIRVGNPIPKTLQLSIDPKDESESNFSHDHQGNLRVPKALKWMFDFDEAIKVGMGMKIEIEENFYNEGFDRVIVTGIKNESANEGQKRVQELFENHHYTDGGLELLEVDTPTNNAEDAKSPYSELDDDIDFAYEELIKEKNSSEIQKPYTFQNELHIADGQYFREAFGLHRDFAIRIPRILKQDISQGRAMNRALYNATIKYFMKTMAAGWFNNNDEIRTLEFLQNYLSAIGSIPSFRIGPQPYGVLPITVYGNFITGTAASTKGSLPSFIRSLSKLSNIIRQDFEDVLSSSNKTRDINNPKYNEDPQKYFLEILGLEPNTKAYLYRHGTNIMGRLKEPDELDDSVISVNWDRNPQKFSPLSLNNLIGDFLDAMGFKNHIAKIASINRTRVYKARYNYANHVLGPTVQEEDLGMESLATVDGLQEGENYITWLKNNRNAIINIKIEDLPKVSTGGTPKIQTTLLLAMIRGALVYDRSPKVVQALEILEKLPIPKLERMLANHLDLCSHRVDAWMEGLSAWRLREMRNSNGTGTYVGAYGILENLRPQHQTHKSENVPDGLRPAEGYPVYKVDDNQGFIHAPSMQHATTAAVLRAGFNAMKEREGNDKNILSINLSSSRVRKALFLLQGVSQGQSPGALLGFQFERALHEKYKFHDNQGKPQDHLEMDVFIYRLRRKFPTYGDAPVDAATDTSSNESIRANNVVDGLALLKHFENHLETVGQWNPDKTFAQMMASGEWSNLQINHIPTELAPILPNINVSNAVQRNRNRQKMLAIIQELDEMADAFDALGDLITSESVYQLVRGNHQRAAGLMNSFAEGKIPRDPEIIKNLRNGNLIINRGIFILPDQGNAALWGIPASPKSLAEPRFNLYVHQQIGDPTGIQFSVINQGSKHYLNLLDIGLQPIDLLFLLGRDADSKWEEIELRVVRTLQQEGFASEGDYQFIFSEHMESESTDLLSTIPYFEAIFDLFNSCRVADARDFRRAEDPDNFEVDNAGMDLTQYLDRIQSAIAEFDSVYTALGNLDLNVESLSASDSESAYALFGRLSQLGFAGYFPNPLLSPSTFVHEQMGKLQEAQSRMSIKAREIQQWREQLLLETDQAKIINIGNEIINAIFGNGMKILPKIHLPNPSFWQDAMQEDLESHLLQHSGMEGLEKWQHDSSLVRKNIAKVENLRILQEVLEKPEISLKPSQMALSAQEHPSEYWMALDYPDTYQPEGDYLCHLLYNGDALIGQTHIAALVVDEWAEIIPQKVQTTGVALHYNQPDARAPQSILMAVPPEIKGQLDLDQILLTVEEALDLAKLRTFEPDDLDESTFSQLLPASSALAYGHYEFLRSLEEDQDPDQQSLGWYIDYAISNHNVNNNE
ncbi:hypothetical protein [Arthrospiribacter ruber]|uniref:Uncharacterized protein n=1 Tax=Arthrospiribacter ruber TaxID=2487934 RepID=A0A951ISM8_9BACT|nr:hypothetical protein [Arthrospiribacter ruber]MBW3466678.1 hypothetical protein [Arthrospiribacter ruber]